jgi:Protein of unknown function (DUF3134)
MTDNFAKHFPNKRATVIRSSNEFVLLEWLKSTGRLIPREVQESEYSNEVGEISDMIEIDEIPYDLDDDDMSVDLED